VLASSAAALAQAPTELDREAGRASRDRALAHLLAAQKPNGAFGVGVIEGVLDSHYAVASYHAWQVAAHAIACLALLECEETPERRAALERALEWLCTTPMPLRGSDWDNDAVWAWLYGTVACTRIAQDPRFAEPPWSERIAARGREFLGWLVKNQVPDGGFGYYDDPPYTRRPKWSTSFSTALVLPALRDAEGLGWLDDEAVRARATTYVRRCRLPNGAYEYDLRPVPRLTGGESINDVKGSLGRIQVCHWALRSTGDEEVTLDRLRTGIARFFEHHEFLAIARMRPIPHEAYYANAGYFFFFGHYYCALAIELLPAEEREPWRRKLRARIAAVQRPDGSFCDFLGQTYLVTADTAFAALALTAGLRDD
jgi:hypothetical protein